MSKPQNRNKLRGDETNAATRPTASELAQRAESGSLPRRRFLAVAATSVAAVTAFGAAGFAHARQAAATTGAAPTAGKLRILILGGTGFLGPHVIDAAKAAGHHVTTFNRGRREKFVGTRDGIDKLYGNRDPDKRAGVKFVDGKEVDDESTPLGLEELKGKTFDAVIDNSAYYPRHVKASAELLAPNAKQYLLISTISVYRDNSLANKDETDALGTIPDPTVENMGAQGENYGPLKALCEKAAEDAMPGRVNVIRPGFIVGVGDTTDRFTYWPVRMSQGGEMIWPGTANDPVQFVDVRDLAEFMIRCVEKNIMGIYNVTGPAKRFTNGELLAACTAAAKSAGVAEPAKPVWASYEWLGSQSVGPGMFPILLPPDGAFAGFHSRNIDRAIKAGLTFRTAEDTCKSLIEWWPKAVELRTRVGKEQVEAAKKEGRTPPQMPNPERLRVAITPEREQQLLAQLKKTEDKPGEEKKPG